MKPKDKAEYLIHKYLNNTGMVLITKTDAKYCSIIAVEEIQEAVSDFAYSNNTWDKQYNDGGRKTGDFADAEQYWQQVKEEIEKM